MTYDTVYVRDVPVEFSALAAAILSLGVAVESQANRIVIDQGSRITDFDIRDVQRACARVGGREIGMSLPEQREPRTRYWTAGLSDSICSKEQNNG